MRAVAPANRNGQPEDWEVSSLGDEVELKNGSAFKAEDWKASGIPIVRIQNLKDRRASFNYFQGDPRTRVALKRGDLLFSWSGSKGTSFGPHYWWGEAAVLNQHIFRVDLKPKSRVTKEFLYFALLYLTVEIESHAYGLAALVHVRKGDLEATQLPVPQEAEQREIASVLGLVQRAMEQQERLLALTAELKKTLLLQLFTHGLRDEPQKQTELGPVPQSWELVELGGENPRLLDVMRNGYTGEQTTEPQPFLVSRIETIGHGFIDVNRVRYAVSPSDDAIEKYRVRCGDILFSHINSDRHLGKTGIAERGFDDLLHGMNLLLLRSRPDFVNPWFLNYLFQWYRQKGVFIAICSRAVNQSSINQGKMKALQIPLPKITEQIEIVNALKSVDSKSDLHRRKHTALSALFRTLLRELMTARIRVHDLDLESI